MTTMELRIKEMELSAMVDVAYNRLMENLGWMRMPSIEKPLKNGQKLQMKRLSASKKKSSTEKLSFYYLANVNSRSGTEKLYHIMMQFVKTKFFVKCNKKKHLKLCKIIY